VYNKQTGKASTEEKSIVDCYCFYTSFTKDYLTITEHDVTAWVNDTKQKLQDNATDLKSENELRNDRQDIEYLDSIILRKQMLHINTCDFYETELYYEYKTNKDIKNWITNIVSEIRSLYRNYPAPHPEKMVLHDKEHHLQLHHILNTNKILRMDHSFKLNTVVDNKKIDIHRILEKQSSS